mmetsp:Transcript_13944/g.11900  ORF Transcript_13944/g.11900 Transcript_13944/m.11900 type:complete len:144 (+) Transcript_13944:1-432(+)
MALIRLFCHCPVVGPDQIPSSLVIILATAACTVEPLDCISAANTIISLSESSPPHTLPNPIQYAAHQVKSVNRIYLSRGGYKEFEKLFPMLCIGDEWAGDSKPYAYGIYPIWCGDGAITGTILDGSNKALLPLSSSWARPNTF